MNSGLCEHCLRVAYLVTDMTILLGMDEKATMDVQLAAIYHDIGKTQIPEQVLNKPGKLTPGEYFIMKLHAEIGYRMIQCHTSPETIRTFSAKNWKPPKWSYTTMKITMAADILDCREMISPMEPEFFGSVMYMML